MNGINIVRNMTHQGIERKHSKHLVAGGALRNPVNIIWPSPTAVCSLTASPGPTARTGKID